MTFLVLGTLLVCDLEKVEMFEIYLHIGLGKKIIREADDPLRCDMFFFILSSLFRVYPCLSYGSFIRIEYATAMAPTPTPNPSTVFVVSVTMCRLEGELGKPPHDQLPTVPVLGGVVFFLVAAPLRQTAIAGGSGRIKPVMGRSRLRLFKPRYRSRLSRTSRSACRWPKILSAINMGVSSLLEKYTIRFSSGCTIS